MRRTRRSVLLALPLMTGFGACTDFDCTPTTTQAIEASTIDLDNLKESSVLEARLTSSRGPVAGRAMRFWLEGDFVAAVDTSAKGVARLHLSNHLDELVTHLDADTFEAVFRGDHEFCPSAGDAPIRLVRSSAGNANQP